jgi:hypothetical protein
MPMFRMSARGNSLDTFFAPAGCGFLVLIPVLMEMLLTYHR